MRRIVVGLLLSIAGCGGEAQTGARAFVSDGSDGSYVGIVGDDVAMTAYVCDGTMGADAVDVWFDGDIDDGDTFEITAGDGSVISGTFDGENGVSGLVELASGAMIPFDGDPAPIDENTSGLFRAEGTSSGGDDLLGGWILLSEDDQRGAVRNTATNTVVANPQLMPSVPNVMLQVDGASEQLQWNNYINAYNR